MAVLTRFQKKLEGNGPVARACGNDLYCRSLNWPYKICSCVALKIPSSFLTLPEMGFEPRTSCTKVRYLNHKAMQEEGGCNSKLAINTTTIAVSLKMASEAASDLGGHF